MLAPARTMPVRRVGELTIRPGTVEGERSSGLCCTWAKVDGYSFNTKRFTFAAFKVKAEYLRSEPVCIFKPPSLAPKLG